MAVSVLHSAYLSHRWLVDVGVAQLAADGLSEEIADSILAQENAELIKSDEILKLVDDWPTYCGRKISTDARQSLA